MKDILVIDDEKDVLDMIRAVLNTKGYRIRLALGGQKGLDELAQRPPDLIICDLMMPGISGREVIRQVKQSPDLQNIPFITISNVGADMKHPTSFWAQGLGVDEYIMKPFDPMDLLGRVEALLRRTGYGPSAAVSLPSGKPEPSESEARLSELSKAEPTTVALSYLEAWNTQNWRLEYDLTAEEVRSLYSYEEYRNARLRSFAEDRTTYIFEEKTPAQINGPVATTTFLKSSTTQVPPKAPRTIQVTLRQTQNGWKILRARQIE
ncbi:MAG: response regulator [Candidatus Sumerlaeia bacterium]|nr:response regulator [Candidatus Sumerlaeia bacterium]